MEPWDLRSELIGRIKSQGGWVNTHSHLDRAFLSRKLGLAKTIEFYHLPIQQKWDAWKDARENQTDDEIYQNICLGIERMIEQDVKVVCSFIDIDPVMGDRAIKAALKAREHYQSDIKLLFANQTLQGVIAPEARKWFDIAMDYVDIIGGLPGRDERDFGKGREHLDIILKKGKELNKLVHVHVDQLDDPAETETEILCDKVMEHGMQNRVVGIHGISLAAHPKSYRESVYAKMQSAGVAMISCPFVWIDHQRSEQLMPQHKDLTPVDEMAPKGITVALGTDNIGDISAPFGDGDMWQELRLLATGNRYFEIDELVNIATVNGRKVLGIDH